MKPEELRIGNIVNAIGKDRVVLGISKYNNITNTETARRYIEFKGIIPINEIHIKPISLTEEWLLKFGFKKHNGYYHIKIETDSMHSFIYLLQSNGNYTYGHGNWFTNLKYVHTLQNFYFVLTGKELEINL